MENNNKYDLTILSSDEDLSSVKDLLEKLKVEDLKTTDSVSVNLAYSVKKHNDAFMSIFKFSLDSDSVESLHKEIKLLPDNILRSLLIKELLQKEKKSKKTFIKKDIKESKSEKSSTKASVDKKEDLLTNEAIEKKIEEILN
ncbi:MAG: 30S ribosomal protein S6 [Candidatus Paceibacterota bacterium]